MSDTSFTNGVTLTDADWFNDLNRLHYTLLGDPATLAALRGTVGICKVGSFTRDTSLASGTQAITGVGFQPKAVVLLAGNASSGDTAVSVGVDDGTTHVSIGHTAASDDWIVDLTFSAAIYVSVGNTYAGSITAFGADGFTVTWVKNGSPTGTYTFGYMALL